MATLGDTLKERRQSLGVTLEQAEAATRIRARLLSALERGDYGQLPAPGYVRGYISSYARYLELDPVPLLAMHKAESGAPSASDLSLPQISEAVVSRHEQHAIPWRAGVAILLLAALISLSLWVATRIWRGPEPTPPEPRVPPQETSSPDATETPAANHDSEPPNDVLPFTVEVRVSPTGASWLLITVDDRKAYEGTLTGGQAKTYEVARTASIKIGRPSEVTVLQDGKQIAIPKGDTPTVVLNASDSP